MPEAREVPIPPPQVFRYTFTSGEKKWNADMYSPLELWQTSQFSGKWTDQRSNNLILATITTVFPADKFQQKHVTREDFSNALNEANRVAKEWDDESIKKWVESFTGMQDVPVKTVQRIPSRIRAIKSFTLSDTAYGYAFCVNRPALAPNPATSIWYFAMLDLNPRVDTERAQKSIVEQFFPSIYPVKMVQKQTAVSTSFQSASFSGKQQKSPEFIASRQLVTDSIKNMKDWWYAETENYIFLSNLKSNYRVTIKDLQERIEYLRNAFEQFMPPRKDITAISVVRAFSSADEYVSYVDKDMAWSWGLWSPTHKELVIRPIEGAGAKVQREEFFRIVFHEAFHQYIYYAFDQNSPAVWFNEGHADFYSAALINDRKFYIGENSSSVKAVDEMVRTKTIDIHRLIHLTYEQFYDESREIRHKNYALAWALIYYLRKSAPLDSPAKYAKILDKYSDALWETKDKDKATEIAFETIDINSLQRDFILFWTSQRKRGEALRNNIFKAYNPGAKK
ncbi:MAG: hypothetical protein A2283_10410 [Lentisphaerae bacterium RIFOXYA12_FULL_48_11]|nr:MAG: hypothetical protein A2283_10410 [Lentisphaerae bacterium RIFOXYA12_FULL_48_11]